MTYKQIEASREARLWIKDVIAPIGAIVVVVAWQPEARELVSNGVKKIKESIKKKFKKD